MPNIVHKSEIVKLYITEGEKEGYTNKNERPSVRTIWNMLKNCPASQHKSLCGLDNVAAEGSNSFNLMVITTAELKNLSYKLF